MENLYLKRSREIKDYTIANRRAFHSFAEVGFDNPKTLAYLMEKLEEIGVKPVKVGKAGVTCTVGSGKGKTILLRADMDALPMTEESGLDFAATNGACHSCGHDTHTAMLLSAVKLLKERENQLNGNVKFMFQPAEELLSGALDMIEHGILESVDVGLGMHINTGKAESSLGEIEYCAGPASFSGDAYVIDVTGCAAHGSTPEAGVDAITIASHIVINLQELLAREISCFDNAVLLIGTISGGTTSNTVAGEASLGCTIRATTDETRAFLNKRVHEVVNGTAEMFRGTAKLTNVFGTVPMMNEVEFSHKMAKLAGDIVGEDKLHCVRPSCGGEDFAYVAQKIPTAFFFIGAGSTKDGYEFSLHHPKMRVDEKVFELGAAIYAHCAEEYLK